MEDLYRLSEIRRSYCFDNRFSAEAVIYVDDEHCRFRLLLKCSSMSSPPFVSVRRACFENSFPQESVWIQMMQKIENRYGLNAAVLVREKFEAVFSSPEGERRIITVSENAVSRQAGLSCVAEDGKKIFKKVKINMRDSEELLCVCRLWLQKMRDG